MLFLRNLLVTRAQGPQFQCLEQLHVVAVDLGSIPYLPKWFYLLLHIQGDREKLRAHTAKTEKTLAVVPGAISCLNKNSLSKNSSTNSRTMRTIVP